MSMPTEVLERLKREAKEEARMWFFDELTSSVSSPISERDAEYAATMSSDRLEAYAAAAIAYKIKIWEMERWVFVSDRLPVQDQRVLVHYIDCGEAVIDVWSFDPTNPLWTDGTITHWKPLPAAPTESE